MGSDLKVVNSARVSFGKKSLEFNDKDERLLNRLFKDGHYSTTRHCSMTFHIKCPLFIRDQITKHRAGAVVGDWEVNSVSFRYVNTEDFDFWRPRIFRRQSQDNKQGSYGEVEDQRLLEIRWEHSAKRHIEDYKFFIEAGVCREQARGMLPEAMFTEFYLTASLQACFYFIELRSEEGAQEEIREYAEAIRYFLSQNFPKTYKAYQDNRWNR